MRRLLPVILAPLLRFVTGAPLEPRTSCTPTPHDRVDNFDQHVQVVPVAAADPIGDTAGGFLEYNSFSYADKALGAATLAPPSPPNVASFSITGELKSGQPYIRGINSTVKSIDLKSLAYSCQVLNGQGSASVTQSCTIQIAGAKAGNAGTVVQELQFNPRLLPVGVKFASTSFASTFKGLVNVTIQAVQSTALEQLTVVSFDDITYTAYTC